jgi:hypothetical protein
MTTGVLKTQYRRTNDHYIAPLGCERKTTIFRPAKRRVLSVLNPRLFTARFVQGFPLTPLEPFAYRPVADPELCGDLP